MPSKPQMWLDSKLPKTHLVPINPDTGDMWAERFERLQELATQYRYSGSYEEEARKEWKAEYDALKVGVEFREVPYFVEHKLMLGAAMIGLGETTIPHFDEDKWKYRAESAPKNYDAEKVPAILGCHPETWAVLPDAFKADYETSDQDAWRAEQENKMAAHRT